jgi:molecular chaperone IbpA
MGDKRRNAMTNALITDFLNRSIGWDKLFEDLTRKSVGNFPPYNIVKEPEGAEIQIALAGYSKDDISVTFQDGVLVVQSEGAEDNDVQYAYKGIAKRKFISKFSLGKYYEVQDVSMKDGMLYVFVAEVLPEEKKLKTFTIN